jgi:hypothetical protein
MTLFGSNKPLTSDQMKENLKKLGNEKIRLVEKANYETAKKALLDDIEKQKKRIKAAQPPMSLGSFLPQGLNKGTLIVLLIIVVAVIVLAGRC